MHIWEELPRGLTVLPINVLGGETDSETCGHLFKVTQQLGSLGLDSDLPPIWTFEPEKAKCVPNCVLTQRRGGRGELCRLLFPMQTWRKEGKSGRRKGAWWEGGWSPQSSRSRGC